MEWTTAPATHPQPATLAHQHTRHETRDAINTLLLLFFFAFFILSIIIIIMCVGVVWMTLALLSDWMRCEDDVMSKTMYPTRIFGSWARYVYLVQSLSSPFLVTHNGAGVHTFMRVTMVADWLLFLPPSPPSLFWFFFFSLLAGWLAGFPHKPHTYRMYYIHTYVRIWCVASVSVLCVPVHIVASRRIYFSSYPRNVLAESAPLLSLSLSRTCSPNCNVIIIICLAAFRLRAKQIRE